MNSLWNLEGDMGESESTKAEQYLEHGPLTTNISVCSMYYTTCLHYRQAALLFLFLKVMISCYFCF